jgi:hypothetical protein
VTETRVPAEQRTSGGWEAVEVGSEGMSFVGAGQDDEMDWSGWAVTRRAGGRDGAYRLDRHLHGANREPQVPWGKVLGCRGFPAADLDWPASIKLPVLGPTEVSRQYPVRSLTGEERGHGEYPGPIDAANA